MILGDMGYQERPKDQESKKLDLINFDQELGPSPVIRFNPCNKCKGDTVAAVFLCKSPRDSAEI